MEGSMLSERERSEVLVRLLTRYPVVAIEVGTMRVKGVYRSVDEAANDLGLKGLEILRSMKEQAAVDGFAFVERLAFEQRFGNSLSHVGADLREGFHPAGSRDPNRQVRVRGAGRRGGARKRAAGGNTPREIFAVNPESREAVFRFASVSEAAEYTHTSRSSIARAAEEGSAFAGLLWVPVDEWELFHADATHPGGPRSDCGSGSDTGGSRRIGVVCIEDNRYFPTAAAAAEAVGISSRSNLTRAIARKGTCGGLHWRFATADEAESAGMGSGNRIPGAGVSDGCGREIGGGAPDGRGGGMSDSETEVASRRIAKIDPDTLEVVSLYPTIAAAARSVGASRSTISRALHGGRVSNGCRWGEISGRDSLVLGIDGQTRTLPLPAGIAVFPGSIGDADLLCGSACPPCEGVSGDGSEDSSDGSGMEPDGCIDPAAGTGSDVGGVVSDDTSIGAAGIDEDGGSSGGGSGSSGVGKGRRHDHIVRLDPVTLEPVAVYTSIRKAAEDIGVHHSSISRALKNRSVCKGSYWYDSDKIARPSRRRFA